jgi:hypothetical protein
VYQGARPLQQGAQTRWARGGIDVRALEADEVWGRQTPNLCALDPGGSDRTITLPEPTESDGMFVLLKHTGTANTITVQAPAGELGQLAAGDSGIVCCDGSAWHLVPW